MPNAIKYSVSSETLALKKGNFYIGTGDVSKGPTSSTGYYNGITPPTGGYTIYLNKESNGPSIYTVTSDSELISLTNKIVGTSYTTIGDALNYYNTQTDKFVLNNNLPAIVTDGLSCYLNPGNVVSYPKTGSVWYDLKNGLLFNSYGSQTSFTTMGGAPAFQFNGSGYWACTSNFSLVDFAGDCTLIMWIYNTDNPHDGRRTIFQKNGTIYAPYEQEIAVTWEAATDLSWYSRYADYDYGATSALGGGGWSMVGIKMSTGKGTACRTGFFSINGAAWYNNYFCRSNNPIVPADAIIIGTGYSGTVSQGSIGQVMCYNKMLSDTEVSQIYEATKSTYGL
jgi:hypothetical protein